MCGGVIGLLAIVELIKSLRSETGTSSIQKMLVDWLKDFLMSNRQICRRERERCNRHTHNSSYKNAKWSTDDG